jgi:hypothetical protein
MQRGSSQLRFRLPTKSNHLSWTGQIGFSICDVNDRWPWFQLQQLHAASFPRGWEPSIRHLPPTNEFANERHRRKSDTTLSTLRTLCQPCELFVE